jgi:hypothetical protein
MRGDSMLDVSEEWTASMPGYCEKSGESLSKFTGSSHFLMPGQFCPHDLAYR